MGWVEVDEGNSGAASPRKRRDGTGQVCGKCAVAGRAGGWGRRRRERRLVNLRVRLGLGGVRVGLRKRRERR